MLLKMGEVRALGLLVSPQVLKEIERAVRKKAPERLGVLALLLDRSGVTVTDPPLAGTLAQVNQYLDYVPDAYDSGFCDRRTERLLRYLG